MDKEFNTIILGAGASGLFLGANLSQSVAIIDGNLVTGKKILVSGGGKCNLTNRYVSAQNYLGDKNFIEPLLERFSNQDLLDYFRSQKIEFELRENTQYFCKTSARDIVEVLEKNTKHCHFFLGQKIIKVEKHKDLFVVTTDKAIFKAQRVVVASGLESYKQIGASSIGLDIARSFGMGVIKTAPALVGFTVQPEEFWFKKLSGISCKAKAYIGNKSFVGDILFTHKGVSGPLILNASVYRSKGSIELDFLPDFDFKKIVASNKFISTTMPLAKRFLKEFLEAKKIKDAPFKDLKKEDKEIIKTLKAYTFAPAGDFGYAKAEVSKGGVDTQELNPQNLESKTVKDLFFIGEVVDVTGELGGYNFQWAFSSAFCCAEYLKGNE